MMRLKNFMVSVLIGLFLVQPVLAASSADCLQRNRMVSWSAVDEDTLVFLDRFRKPYTVEMTHRCMGVTLPGAILIYDRWLNLACLQRGQIIHVAAPGLVRSTCSIASVTGGAPGAGN